MVGHAVVFQLKHIQPKRQERFQLILGRTIKAKELITQNAHVCQIL